MTDVAIVKGRTPGGDRVRVSLPDGTSRRAAACVIRDLPHLVVESAFGIDDGLWGTLAVSRARIRAGLAADAAFGGLAERNQPGHIVAKAAVGAVVNRWRHGPDTPDGVRERLRACAERETWLASRIGELAVCLDDGTISAARDGVRRVCRQWARLPVGGVLRLTWPQW